MTPDRLQRAGDAAADEAGTCRRRRSASIMDLFRGAGGGNDCSRPARNPGCRRRAARPGAASTRRTGAGSRGRQPVTGSGFVVQLASFRSDAEARKEYGRLSSLYPSVVGGLQQQIRQTSVGGSTRYQLGLGPLPSRSDATRGVQRADHRGRERLHRARPLMARAVHRWHDPIGAFISGCLGHGAEPGRARLLRPHQSVGPHPVQAQLPDAGAAEDA